MRFNLHITHHFPVIEEKLEEHSRLLTILIQKSNITINNQKMNQTELLTKLSDIGTQLNKAKDEIIAALSAAGTLTPEVEAAVNNISSIAQQLDDLNPDA